MSKQNPFKYFKTSPEVIKLAIWYYICFPLSLRNVEDILHERGIDICHEAVRFGGTDLVQFLQRSCGAQGLEITKLTNIRTINVKIRISIFEGRDRAWGKFRSMGSLQKITSIQSQFHNHFQHQRL